MIGIWYLLNRKVTRSLGARFYTTLHCKMQKSKIVIFMFVFTRESSYCFSES